MARQFLALLRRLGHHVIVVSELRSWLREPGQLPAIAAAAQAELTRMQPVLDALRPDLWFTYHLYYKAPDLLGPATAKRLGIPYVVAEASHAPKRLDGPWADAEKASMAAQQSARVLLTLTDRDADGLAMLDGFSAAIASFPPFLTRVDPMDPPPRLLKPAVRLICVAMMRDGNKLESYRQLALALGKLERDDWRLRMIGDGPARAQVEAAFSAFPAARISFAGACTPAEIQAELEQADIFVWPGYGEAYGMVYLEAQERGLPVVATDSGGVASVVHDGDTGILVAEGDCDAFANAVQTLIANPALRQKLGAQARSKVLAKHGPDAAAQRLQAALERAMKGMPA
ncbi:MAG: glycosyltransferase family 4 protein [Bosea sp. (in: a-proteobacteria)]